MFKSLIKEIALLKRKYSTFINPNRKRVDFLIFGAQKSGTSALDYYLRKHPQIGMAAGKELHYFDNENYNWKSPNYLDYEKLFNFEKNVVVYGESTPIYMFWRNSASRIYRYNKKIKLIFILKGPFVSCVLSLFHGI